MDVHAAAAQPAGTALSDLPDDLLLRVLEPLSQSERFKHAALTSKRFRRICLAPSLLRTVTQECMHTSPSDVIPRTRSLLHFLAAHAAHVRTLRLNIDVNEFDGPESAELSALIASCLTACGAAGQLECLVLEGGFTPASTASLLTLTALRQLEIVSDDLAPLPAGLSRLTALVDARAIDSAVLLAEGATLPPALTRLCLNHEFEAPLLPRQIFSLSALVELAVAACDDLDPLSCACLSSLPALRRLTLHAAGGNDIELPSLSAVTQLRNLSSTACSPMYLCLSWRTLSLRTSHSCASTSAWRPECSPSPSCRSCRGCSSLAMLMSTCSCRPAPGCAPYAGWAALANAGGGGGLAAGSVTAGIPVLCRRTTRPQLLA